MKIFYFLSDKDLVFLVNNNLPKKKTSGSIFEKWKAGKFLPNEETGKNLFNVFNMHN
jgi:hypothetical protein